MPVIVKTSSSRHSPRHEVLGVIEIPVNWHWHYTRDVLRPRAAGGMRGAPRMINAEILFWRCQRHRPTPSTIQTALFAPPKASIRFPGSLIAFLRPSSRRRLLEMPKAPPESPERECGFLGVVEDLHQALGVIEPFLRDPRAAGGMRGRPRVMNATPHKQLLTRGAAFDSTPPHTPSRRSPARPQKRGDYAGTSRGPYLDVYYLEGLSLTPAPSPDAAVDTLELE
ncbi:hypothetical protein EV122DRAFT_285297 [Schizophyllum commune]